MSIVLLIYGAILLAIAITGIAVFRYFARRSRWLGFILALIVMAALVLLWPIPIHGGVTFVIAELYDEVYAKWQQRGESKVAQQRREFVQRQNDRFFGTADFAIIAQLSENWYQVSVAGQRNGWYDAGNKLIWSDWLPLTGTAALPSLDSAKQACRAYPPGGYWALANEAENSLLWKAQGQQWMPKASYSSVSYSANETLRTELPFYGLRNLTGTAPGQSTIRAPFAVRCVALAAGAPSGGYREKDITLADWNTYQLQKLQAQK